jgi:hypothetical protein
MKGISPIIGLALTILLVTSTTILIVTVLKPTLDKAKAYSIFNEGIQNLELLNSAIKEVASEAEGSKRTISITVSDGEYKINSPYDWLYFEYDPPADLGLSGRRGDIWIERGLEFADWFNGYVENSLPYSLYNLSGSWKVVNERLEGEKGLAFYNLSKKFLGFSFSANLENSDGQGEVFVSPVNPQNLTLFLPFDEGSGTIAYDFSGNNNNGTLYNGSIVCSGGDCPNWVDGKFGKALSFDGVDDYVNISDSVSLDFSGSFTMEYWVKFNNVSGEQWLVSKGGGWNRKGFFSTIGISPGVLRFGMGNGTTEVVADNSGFTTGVWYHIVMTYDGLTMRVYSNGVLLPNSATNTFAYVNDYPVRVGGSDGTSFLPFNGTIDEVRIYNRALNEEEIKAEYEAGLKKLSSSGTQTISSTFSPYLVLSNPSGKTYFDSIRINSNYKKLNLVIPFSRIDLNGTFRVSRGTHDIIIENRGFNSTSNKPIIQITAS